MNPQIRVIIVDDHQQVRETWKLLLEQDKRFIVIAECENGQEAIDIVKQLLPDIILMDINMTPVNGLEATRKILKQLPAMKIIGLSINDQPSYAKTMLDIGAKGYVTKSSSKHEMARAILAVFNGEQYICEEVRNKMKHE